MGTGDDFERLHYVLVAEPFGDVALPQRPRTFSGAVDRDHLYRHVFAVRRIGPPDGTESAAPYNLRQLVAILALNVTCLGHVRYIV